MASSDWGDIWTWASAAPPPTDPTKGWSEADEPAWDVYGNPGSQLVWQKTSSDNGEFTGRFYASGGASSGTSRLMRAGCKYQGNGNWKDRTGLFLGNPSFREGDATGGAAQDEINGVLFGFDTSGNNYDTRNLYAWRIEHGVAYSLGYYVIPALILSIDSSHGSIFEFDAALLVDDSQYLRGGYNNDVYDANRITGLSYARPYVRWNAGGSGYSTTTALYTWDTTNVVTTNDTSEVSVGDFIRAVPYLNYYKITFIDPNVAVYIDISGRPTPPNRSDVVAQYFDPNPGDAWTDWQLITEVNDSVNPGVLKAMIEGDYCVGIVAMGTGWASGGVNQAVFDKVFFDKGTTP